MALGVNQTLGADKPEIIDRQLLTERASAVFGGLAFVPAVLLTINGETAGAAALFLLSVAAAANLLAVRRSGPGPRSTSTVLACGVLLYGLATSQTGGLTGPAGTLGAAIPLLAVLLGGARAGWMALLAVIVCVAATETLAGGPVPRWQAGTTITYSVSFGAIALTTLLVAGTCYWFTSATETLLSTNWKQAHFDHLTGIRNRRAIESVLLLERSRSARDHTWFSLIIADIDHFKKLNDREGHLTGDRCLTIVARRIEECLMRPSDLVGRFGGEEFVIVLPETPPEGATHIGERIRLAVEGSSRLRTLAGGHPVTLTLGVVSTHGESAWSVSDLLNQADAALYEGKSTGRNQVICRVPDDSGVAGDSSAPGTGSRGGAQT